MSVKNPSPEKPTLDKDLEKFAFIESATSFVLRKTASRGLALIFLALSALLATLFATGNPDAAAIVAGAAIAAYMAMNIGANDVTNNVGAAVGAKAISLAVALLLAAIFEIAGAMISGGAVVETMKTGIINSSGFIHGGDMITIMISALLAAALWINLATWINAPVSTTHSIVGAVIGSAASMMGSGAINWAIVGSITLAWVLSPLISATIAIGFLWLIKDRILYAQDKIAGARLWVPILLATMTGSFTSFIMLEAIGRVIGASTRQSLALGIVTGLVSFLVFRHRIHAISIGLENKNNSIKIMFRWPLVMAACLLSFAHGANDVANAIGPLAAIVEAAGIRSVTSNLDAPLWVMLIGAFGISTGLILFGPRLIRVVGEQITKLNPMRAFCVSLSAAITVIVASLLGLPVSSTHIAVGAVFGVGLFREWYNARSDRRRAYIEAKAKSRDETRAANPSNALPDPDYLDEQELGESENSRYRYLVRRSHLMSISAAWIVTVPLSGALSALITWFLRNLSF